MNDELDCKAISRLISDGQDRDLPPAERARMRLHFVICETCRDVNDQFSFLREAMKRLSRNEPPAE
ncbi:MAG: zf-HC2 domain-containing protein [Rhizobacter sp.]|jgi:predicted anti-sigma-YlaC factor YlaD|nr:zf-HC2 domain-containing protein [Rhizobacter sp.]HOX68395.1 zf-HC2 domain-containing protein [Burkholderiaceae bacterium]